MESADTHKKSEAEIVFIPLATSLFGAVEGF